MIILLMQSEKRATFLPAASQPHKNENHHHPIQSLVHGRKRPLLNQMVRQRRRGAQFQMDERGKRGYHQTGIQAMRTRKCYLARIPATGWFIRCPRWFYNRWPWAGIVHIWDEKEDGDVPNCYGVHDPVDGPRIPARHGSFPTQVCSSCGMWRINPSITYHGWQPANTLQARLKEDENA